MAFTSRAQRQTFDKLTGSTPATVGPGSYGTYYSQEVEHAYAPFSSTTDREIGGGQKAVEFVTPGPGSYDVTGKRYMGGPRFQTAPTEVGFLSKAQRLNEAAAAVAKPGPGSYEIKSGFQGNKKGRTAEKTEPPAGVGREDKHVVWFRAPTAPSIPKQDQAFGYEEGPGGALVKQKAPVQTFKGEKGDTVGPGNYDVNTASTRPIPKGFDFGRSKTTRADFVRQTAAVEAPGPGTYELAQPEFQEMPPQRKKPTASFSSRVLRPHQVEPRSEEWKKPVPGPGAYVIPDTFTKFRQSLPDSLQCFGSTSKRATDMSNKARIPGPGAYDDPRQAFSEPGVQQGTRLSRRAAPFLSTSSRFDGLRGRAGAPGPGQYDESNRDNFVAMMAKKRFSRGGNFGSTSKRFVPPEKTKEAQQPGPGAYEQKPPKQIQGQLKKGPMSVFLSNTSRFVRQEKPAEGPAPGQYYKSVEWGSGYKRPENSSGQKVFISQSDRFKSMQKKETPGPGQYSQAVNTVGAEVQKVLKRQALSGEEQPGGLFGSEVRFFRNPGHNTFKAATAPGPGAYDAVDPYNQLLKRSFNITVEGSV